MIKSVTIEGLRGIEHGQVDGLDRINVFVGPNGSGKSTVLDALLIGAHPKPGDAIGRAASRRSGMVDFGRWFFNAKHENQKIVVKVTSDGGGQRTCIITKKPDSDEKLTPGVEYTIPEAEQGALLNTTTNEITPLPKKFPAMVLFQNGRYQHDRSISHSLQGVGDVRLVQPVHAWGQSRLDDVYREVILKGQDALEAAKAMLRVLVPGLRDLTPMPSKSEKDINGDGEPSGGHPSNLAIVYDNYGLPLEAAGEGIQALVRIALELAARKNGVVLMEEPEVHQHPKAIIKTADLILAAAKRSVQVILTTHSLDLIDALLDAADGDMLGHIRIHRMALVDGTLKITNVSGDNAMALREQLEEDLR